MSWQYQEEFTWPKSRVNWTFGGLSSKLKAAFAQRIFVYWKKQLWSWAVVLAASWAKGWDFRNQFLPTQSLESALPSEEGEPEGWGPHLSLQPRQTLVQGP